MYIATTGPLTRGTVLSNCSNNDSILLAPTSPGANASLKRSSKQKRLRGLESTSEVKRSPALLSCQEEAQHAAHSGFVHSGQTSFRWEWTPMKLVTNVVCPRESF